MTIELISFVRLSLLVPSCALVVSTCQSRLELVRLESRLLSSLVSASNLDIISLQAWQRTLRDDCHMKSRDASDSRQQGEVPQ